ncbi:MAG TPA: ElyC/SanA/YdcF family protein [Holophagaceae bacterium]|nr:ElyC/SanA/YdcF family protein [Holophagaceae bacterium]
MALLVLLDLLWVLWRFPAGTRDQIHGVDALQPTHGPVLILGAGVYSDREPTPVLEGRLRTALDLQRSGKVRWFLVSGDNRTPRYNEPQAMRRWLMKQGVDPTLIASDYAGRRTYDSLVRARDVFGIHRLVIVTSDFHLPRALYLARHLGMDAQGVPASTEGIPEGSRIRFWIREFGARHLALWNTWFPPDDTVLGPREPTPEDLLPPVAP